MLDTFAEKMHDAFAAGTPNDVLYFVGRPGEDGFADRFLETWGSDGHNSHTNVCSSGGRAGYGFWAGTDRPSPDYANARFILLISAHLESGHYFNPHAQRIVEAQQRGAKVAVMDPRLSNTASIADHWLPTWPGSEAAVLLAIAKILLDEGLYNRDFVRRWVNWRTYLAHRAPGSEPTFENFILELRTRVRRSYTPEFAEAESGLPAATVVQIAHEIAAAGTAFASHIWRAAAAGNLHGWQVTRSLMLLNALTGAVGAVGGTSPNAWNKFIPAPWKKPQANEQWNELNWPREYPLAHNEMSPIYPHLLLDGRGTQPLLFTRVLNPIWTYPDGYSWMRALRDESLVGLHGALTPTWSETAWWSDYVLPMGHGPERHDTHSYETHSGRWLGFRQPVQRVARERMGQEVEFTYEANPGEVWEEGEFWIEVSWRADPDGSLGIRQYYESPYRPGEKIRLEEYYRWMFENSVPGLPEKAAAEGMEPLEYMRRYGCVEISRDDYAQHEAEVEVPERRRRRRARGDDHGARVRSLAPAAHRPARHDRHDRRRRRAARLQLPLAQARAVLRDARGVGLAGHGRSASPSQPRAPVADRPCPGRVRPAADLPAADADPLALGQREVPQRARAHPSAARLSRGRDAHRRADRRPRARGDRDRLLRHQGVRDRGHPAGHRGRLASHGPLAPEGDQGHGALVLGARRHGRDRRAGRRSARSTACSRGSPPTPAPRASGGTTPACTRTSRSPCIRTRSAACTAGTRRCACARRCPATATPTSTSTSPRRARSTASGSRVARPASGELRRPIWLFRPVKPVLDAYALPAGRGDARGARARAGAASRRPRRALRAAGLVAGEVWASAGGPPNRVPSPPRRP